MKNKTILGLLLIAFISFILILSHPWEKKVPVLPDTGSNSVISQSAPVTLRVLQYNTHHGGLGTDGKLDLDRLATAAAAQSPDLISMNEIEQFSSGYGNQDDVNIYVQMLTQKTGKTWTGFFFQGNGTQATKGLGNAILTTLAVSSTDHKKLGPARVAGEATVNLGGQTINFFSTHLDDASSAERLREATVLRDWMATFTSGISILAGDINASSSSDPEIVLLKTTLTDSWAQAKIDKTATSAADNPNGNTRNTRLDYIFYPKTQIKLTGAAVPDTRDLKGVMPSDHRPLLATFSLNGTPVPPPPPSNGDVIIHAKDILDANIHGNWAKTSDATAADGIQILNADLKIPKLAAPAVLPKDYFDLTFQALANTPYHLWLRTKAQNNSWANDSIYIQFSDAVDQTGKPIAGISTANAWIGFLEEGTSAGVSGWGWNDNDYGALGSNLMFAKSGTHTLRIQTREDGVSIDQIILSPVKYIAVPPGSLKNDTTIVAE